MNLLDIVENAVMSAVNVAEVWTKVQDLGLRDAPGVETLFPLLSRIEPFTESQARIAANLRLDTKHAGLSLGDRACLALAIELQSDVYTTDKQWAHLQVGPHVHLIR